MQGSRGEPESDSGRRTGALAGGADSYWSEGGSLVTNDGLTVVIAGWPYADFEANKKEIEGNFLKAFHLAPAFAERLRVGSRETRFATASRGSMQE